MTAACLPEFLAGSQILDRYVRHQTVPRPPHLSGPMLAAFLQPYRQRPDSDAHCFRMDRLHVPCEQCDTPPKLILGCGTVHQDGWIAIDRQSDGCDLLWDLQFPLPWPKNSVAKIVAQDLLEHIPGWHSVLLGWIECLRVGGSLNLRVPDMASGNALRDPTHVNLFNDSSLDFLWADDIYRAKQFRRDAVIECTTRRPVINGEHSWTLVKRAPTPERG